MDENKSLADANSEAVKLEENPKKANVSKPEIIKTEVVPENKPAVKEKLVVHDEKQSEKPKVKRERFHFYHIKNAIKKVHPYNIKAKLEHYRFEYSRILHLARKPTKQEFKELSIMVIIGTTIIGVLGFIIQMIIQFI